MCRVSRAFPWFHLISCHTFCEIQRTGYLIERVIFLLLFPVLWLIVSHQLHVSVARIQLNRSHRQSSQLEPEYARSSWIDELRMLWSIFDLRNSEMSEPNRRANLIYDCFDILTLGMRLQ